LGLAVVAAAERLELLLAQLTRPELLPVVLFDSAARVVPVAQKGSC
jgi:hypothetical protein